MNDNKSIRLKKSLSIQTMNTLLVSSLVFFMTFSFTACGTILQESRRWIEEVKLSDGNVINIEREEFIGRQIPLVERNTIKFKTADGKQIQWQSCAVPIALEFVEGKYFLVGVADFSFCTGQLNLPRSSGAAAWQLENNGQIRIENKLVPRSMKPNLVYSGAEAAKAGFVNHTSKHGELHTVRGMPWCIEGWMSTGDITKCPKEGSK